VAEGVPPDIAQAEFSSSRTDIVLLDWTRVVTATGDRAGADAVAAHGPTEGTAHGFRAGRREPRRQASRNLVGSHDARQGDPFADLLASVMRHRVTILLIGVPAGVGASEADTLEGRAVSRDRGGSTPLGGQHWRARTG